MTRANDDAAEALHEQVLRWKERRAEFVATAVSKAIRRHLNKPPVNLDALGPKHKDAAMDVAREALAAGDQFSRDNPI